MRINKQQVLKRLDGKNDGKRWNFYISKSVYSKFQKECTKRGYSASQVVEELMIEFTKQTPRKG